MQEVITELKKKVEEFEEAYSKVEQESHARLKEAEEAQMKASQLQESIERYFCIKRLHIYPIRIIESVISYNYICFTCLQIGIKPI